MPRSDRAAGSTWWASCPRSRLSASLIGAQKSIGGSPLGSPAVTAEMLRFAARHRIAPMTEHFPLSRVNDAMDRLRSGQARYRIVLENDLK